MYMKYENTVGIKNGLTVMAGDSEQVTQHSQIVFNLTGQDIKLHVPQHIN